MSGKILWDIDVHERLESSQLRLKAMADAGAREGAGVQALTQSGGYGRQGRGWVSPPGNLYLSLLLRPPCPVPAVPQLALVAAVALAAAVTPYAPGAFLKWPNDVLAADGRKIAGILLETDIDPAGALNWVALGIGVNIESAPEGLGTALAELAGRDVSRDEFRDAFLEKLSGWYERWLDDGLAPVRRAWLASAHAPGRVLKIKLGAETLDGYFEGLDEAGNLLLRLAGGEIRVIASGEVHFGTDN